MLLGEVDTSGLAKGPGSFAKSQVSNEVRLETVDHDAHLLGSFETDTLIRWMVLLNFGPDAPIPKSIYDSTDAPDRDQRMQGIANALNDGVSVPLGYYRMTMRVPAPIEGGDVVTRPTPTPGGGALSRSAGEGRGGGRLALAEDDPRPSGPYLIWLTQNDDRVRERPSHNHVVMHGMVFAVDHPIWKTWWPPAGHNCRCEIAFITADEAKARGYVGSEPTGPWPIDPQTGLPALPDPGFTASGPSPSQEIS
ncbi:MAG TPA: DUF935 family protein [Thermoanaerobaculia bacterium]|nr:DUF935 family protein [Thermoanaerobaculia bacterium]